jgi:uncharacterized protein YjbI with pentapeptide repeats
MQIRTDNQQDLFTFTVPAVTGTDPKKNKLVQDTYIKSSAITQLNEHLLKSNKLDVANELVRATKKLGHQLALSILMESSRLFSGTEAHHIIKKGIQEENYRRSPLSMGEKTLDFVRNFSKTHPEEVEDFLTNPGRLLIWLNQARPVEISRLFDFYYPADTEYYNHFCLLAEEEYKQEIPEKAFMCFTLMQPVKLSETGREILKNSVSLLQKNEPGNYERIIQSIEVSINPSIENIKIASGCYLNLNKFCALQANFSNLVLDGCNLNNASLIQANLYHASLVGAQMTRASLTSANFVNADLRNAYLVYADLSNSDLLCADFRNANLANANLSYTKLCQTDLRNTNLDKTNLTGAEFFTEGAFLSLYSLAEELHHLAKILYQHQFHEALQQAILNDLLRLATSGNIPRECVVRTLEAAYIHPAFSVHAENHWLKATSNTIVSSFYGFFAKKPEEKEMAALPVYETTAQIAIRNSLARYKPPALAPSSPAVNF